MAYPEREESASRKHFTLSSPILPWRHSTLRYLWFESLTTELKKEAGGDKKILSLSSLCKNAVKSSTLSTFSRLWFLWASCLFTLILSRVPLVWKCWRSSPHLPAWRSLRTIALKGRAFSSIYMFLSLHQCVILSVERFFRERFFTSPSFVVNNHTMGLPSSRIKTSKILKET